MSILFISGLFGFAESSTLKDARNEIRHANTYFWLGLTEKGDMATFYSGLIHIKNAEKILGNLEKTYEAGVLLQEVKVLHQDFINQMEVHFNTMYGVFPVVRMLVPTIFSDASTLGTYELVDKPAEIAATSAGLRLARDIVSRWNAKPQLNVIFNSNTGERLKHKQPDIALEHELLYIFSSLPKFFVHNSREVQKYLTKDEYHIFRDGIEALPGEIIEKLYKGFDCEDLLIVSVNEEDIINGNYFYIIKGHVYTKNRDKPTHTFFQQGFSRNRNRYFWPVIISFFIGLFIAIIMFRWIVYKKSNEKKIFSFSGEFVTVSITSYMLGRLSPWIIVPVFSLIMPVPETIFFLSFWWPCLVGTALFSIPVMIYLMVINRYLCHFDENLEFTGHGAAISLSISIGVCFYLFTALMLYWNSFYGLVRIIIIFLISGRLLYLFGSALDQGEYKFSSEKLVHVMWFFPILFIFGGVIFFGDTVPFKNYWHVPRQMWSLGLFTIPFVFTGIYGKLLKEPAEKTIQSDFNKNPADKLDEDKSISIQKLIDTIKTSQYKYWKSEEFKAKFEKRIKPCIETPDAGCKTVWLKLSGPAGCGKTAAANAVIRKISEQYDGSILQFIGQCREKTNDEISDSSYEPFISAFPKRLIDPLISSQYFFDKAGDFLNLANMLPGFLGIDSLLATMEKDSTHAMNQQRQGELYKAIAEYIKEKAKKNMVIIFFDNMQEVDSASKKLLLFLFKALPPGKGLSILFMIAMDNGNDWLQKDNIISLEFNLPENNDLEKMIIHSLDIEEKSAKLIAGKLNLKMENNLSAVFQYVLMLADKGIIIDCGEDKYKLEKKYLNSNTSANLPEPESYISIIKNEFKELGKEYVRIISYAACLGENFHIATLSSCLKDDDIIDKLDKIEELSGIIFDNRKMDSCFSFRDSVTFRTIRDLLNITFEGPPWPLVSENIKKIHGNIANHYFNKITNGEEETASVFDMCIHFYASGGANAQKTISHCLSAAEMEKNSYNFDSAKKYIEMVIDCAEYLQLPVNYEEEMLLLDCEKLHVENKSNAEIADKCIKYFDDNKKNISMKLLKVISRICYETTRDKPIEDKETTESNNNNYQKIGKETAQTLLDRSIDDFTRAEAYFYMALNESKLDENINNLEMSRKLLEPDNEAGDESKKGDEKERLLSWIEDQLARKLIIKKPENQIESIELFKKSIKRKRKLKDEVGLAMSLGGLGSSLLTEKKYSDARDCFDESLNISSNKSILKGVYLRQYDLGYSYLLEAKKEELSDKKVNTCYQYTMKYFKQGLLTVAEFDEKEKNNCQFYLFSGLLSCTAHLCLWDKFNEYGKELQNLSDKNIKILELLPNIKAAIKSGGDHCTGNWVYNLEEKLKDSNEI